MLGAYYMMMYDSYMNDSSALKNCEVCILIKYSSGHSTECRGKKLT